MTDDPFVQPVTSGAGAPGPSAPPAAGGVKGFFATTAGRIVIIVLGIGALLAVLGLVAMIVLGGVGLTLFNTAVQQSGPVTVTTSPGTKAGAAAASETVPAVATVAYDEVFTPRDPFQPVILPASEADEAADPNTLTLLEVIEENGDLQAVLQLGDTKYTLGAGDSISGTPWQVVSVADGSVVMLYGDTQITLSIGQGISMK